MILLNTYHLEGQLSIPFFILLLVVALVVALISWRHCTFQARLSRVRNGMLKRFDQEKDALSKELHDVVGSFLLPLKAEVEGMPPDKRAAWAVRIQSFEHFIRQTSHTLYPEYIFKGDFNAALSDLSRFLSTDQTHLSVHIQSRLSPEDPRAHPLFRCVLEALTNAIKHDRPERIVLVTTAGPRAFQVMINYAVGEAQEEGGTGFGLHILKERLLAMEGKMTRNEDGTDRQLTLTIPAQW